jgi:hypothetical protein
VLLERVFIMTKLLPFLPNPQSLPLEAYGNNETDGNREFRLAVRAGEVAEPARRCAAIVTVVPRLKEYQ